MKLLEHFRNFLNDTVNLNSTRVDDLESSISSIETFLKNKFPGKILSFEAHGSWAHKTIIRPVEGKAFDADLLMNVGPEEGWDAADYLLELRKSFLSSDLYKSKVVLSSHCVTLNYAGNKKIDIAPCVVNRSGWVRREVCNRHTNDYERTSPTEYTNWLISRNEITGSNNLRKATRLIKYIRDIKKTFSCPSVLLTTLIGNTVNDWDDRNNFKDVPTTLKLVINRLDAFLQNNRAKPYIANPSMNREDLGGLISDDQYANFRDTISRYSGWVDEAYDADNRDESVRLWRKVFGENFASSVSLEEGRQVGKRALISLAKSTTSLAGDLVSLVRQFGARALPPDFDRLPYKHEPEWEYAEGMFASRITATLHKTEQAPAIREVHSLDTVPKNHGLWFDVRDARSQAIPIRDYRVQWRITNTDEEAFQAGQMRGEFNPPKIGNKRWESLAYRGVHTAEAFIIRRSDDRIVSISDSFYVTIE